MEKIKHNNPIIENLLEIRAKFYVRYIIIALAILATPILVVIVSQRALPIVLVLLSGITVLWVFLHRPLMGIATLIIASFFSRFSIGTGTETNINSTVILLTLLIGLWLFDSIFLKRNFALNSPQIARPSLALILVAVIAFGFGQFRWFLVSPAPLRAQIGQLVIIILSVGSFLLVANQINELHWLRIITWVFLISGALFVITYLFPGMRHIHNRIFQRGVEGSLFWTWFAALAFSQALLNKQLGLGWRIILGLTVVCAFYITFYQWGSWISGWAPPLAAILVIIFIGAPRLMVLVVPIGIGITFINWQRISDLSASLFSNNQYSLLTRFEAWRIIGELIKVNPLFGLGPANYYWYTPLIPILGYYVPFNSHNNYIDILAQIGVLGLVCFLWLLWGIGRTGWRIKKQTSEGFSKAYVIGALGGLAGTLAAAMLGDWMIPFVYNIGMGGMRASIFAWIFLGGLVAIEKLNLTNREVSRLS